MQPRHKAYQIFGSEDFRNFIFYRLFAMLAIQIEVVSVAWQVYSLTKDPLSLGLIGLASVLPTFALALLAGHLTDRLPRKWLLVASLVLSLVMVFGLWALSALPHGLSPHAHVNAIYGAVFLGGIARAFIAPAQFAFFSEILPKKDWVQGSAWSSTTWQVAAALGPALGGLLYGFGDARLAFLVAALLLAVGIGFIAVIPARPRPKVDLKEPFVRSLTQGLRFVFGNKLVLSALSLDMFAVLFGGAIALLPVFADRLGVGPEGLGILRAAPSVGASLMALFVAHRPPRKHAGKILLASVLGFGLCMIGFGLSKSFFLSLLILAVSGAFDNISVVVRGTILQLLTPDSMRGRVSAVNQIFISSSNEIGEMESGLTAKWMGTVPAVLFGGCMTLLVVAFIALFSAPMRNLDFNEVEKSQV